MTIFGFFIWPFKSGVKKSFIFVFIQAILAKGKRGELEMRVHLAKKKNEVLKKTGDWPYYTLITQVKTPEEKFEEFLLKNRLKNLTPTNRR